MCGAENVCSVLLDLEDAQPFQACLQRCMEALSRFSFRVRNFTFSRIA